MTWKKIRQCENYSINELGQVRNDTTGQIKKPFVNKDTGYLIVDLWKNNKPLKMAIHRLLAEAFIPNPAGKATVDHRDGNRQNNALSNLRWATYSENNSRFGTVGVRSQRVKVTHYAEQKKHNGVHEAWLEADDVSYFDRIGDAAAYFGVNISSISMMLKKGHIGQRGKTRGYKFEYADGQRITFS